MDRKTKYAINGAIWIGLGNMLFNAIRQWNRIENEPEKKFDWGELFLAGGKGALVGGAGGFVVGAVVDEINANQEAINTDAYLASVLSSIQFDKDSRTYKACEKKCDKVIRFLEDEFGGDLSSVPFQWGSTVKGTAIEGNSDFDIIAQFKRNSFSIEDMYYNVFEAIDDKFHDPDLIRVRKQAKSIGLIFEIGGEEIRIDVVPSRDVDDNTSSTAGNLYLKPKTWFSDASYTKTDIPLQATERLTPTQKKIIMILKKWRDYKGVPMSSYMIQLFVLRAYEAYRYEIPRKFTDKVMMVLQYVHDNIDSARLVSIENTNNDVNNIPDYDKSIIRNETKKVLDEYEYHPNTIQEFFTA